MFLPRVDCRDQILGAFDKVFALSLFILAGGEVDANRRH